MAEPCRLFRGDEHDEIFVLQANIGEYVFVKFCRLAAEMARDGQPIVSFDYSKAFDEVRDKRPPKSW
ncbi:hypothetical protein [Rhizobium indicum]|uniref:Uncharacterized protein n=1 Tax=Rhizobium indicum TaxID=2583231 RepID=A0ABX6PIK4_9HYPH|nr:hypothetical protein [Rhizobium indicum]QKK18882.1 hypothetical protein FFM53_021565 [Rhizobium indicum]